MLIYYCETCGMRISDEEIESGVAVKTSAEAYACEKCAGAKKPAAATTTAMRSTQGVPLPFGGHAATTRAAGRITSRLAGEPPKSGRAANSPGAPLNPVIILSAVGIGLMIAGLALTFSKKKSDEGDKVADTATTATTPLPLTPSGSEKKTEPVNTAAQTAVSSTSPSPAMKTTPSDSTETSSARGGGGLLGALTSQSRSENSGDERQKYGQYLLDEAAKKLKENPDDVWVYRARIDKVFRDYASVQAGKDAAKALGELKPPEGGAWPEGFVNREVWNGIGGGKVADLTKHPNFSKPPNSTLKMTMLATTGDIGDNYGSRIRGYLTAPQNGEYTFWIASDDESELWLSSDDKPDGKKKIASVGSFTGIQEWTKMPSQKSESITLQRGKRYYFEVLHKEGGGGDHIAVGWQLPNKQMERPIGGARLSPAN
jgi:hypothetical protein